MSLNSQNPSIILADTSAIKALARGEITNDFGPQVHPVISWERENPKYKNIVNRSLQHGAPHTNDCEEKACLSTYGVLENLVSSGKKVILTRKHIKELFPTGGGRLDLEQRDNELSLPTCAPEEFRSADSSFIYQAITKFLHKGELRCYQSPQAMMDKGELENPDGGIIIVDTSTEPYPDNGRAISEGSDYWSRGVTQGLSQRTLEGRAKHRDGGDRELINLYKEILRYTRKKKHLFSIGIFNLDKGLNEEILKVCSPDEPQPIMMTPIELIWALHRMPDEPNSELAITEKIASAFTNAANQDTWVSRGRELKLDPNAFSNHVKDIIQWLKDGSYAPTKGIVHDNGDHFIRK